MIYTPCKHEVHRSARDVSIQFGHFTKHLLPSWCPLAQRVGILSQLGAQALEKVRVAWKPGLLRVSSGRLGNRGHFPDLCIGSGALRLPGPERALLHPADLELPFLQLWF